MLCLPWYSGWSSQRFVHSHWVGWDPSGSLHLPRQVRLFTRRQQLGLSRLPKAHHLRSEESDCSHLCRQLTNDDWCLYRCHKSVRQCWYCITNSLGSVPTNPIILRPFRAGKRLWADAVMPSFGAKRKVCLVRLQSASSFVILREIIRFLQRWWWTAWQRRRGTANTNHQKLRCPNCKYNWNLWKRRASASEKGLESNEHPNNSQYK